MRAFLLLKNMKIFFVSLGCDKNLVDSEKMLGLLSDEGYVITDDEKEAEIIVVNSCCFIGDAKQESIDTILSMAKLKEEGKLKLLVVTGCLAQRYEKEILEELPEIDVVIGINSIEIIVAAINEALQEKQPVKKIDEPVLPARSNKERLLTTGGHYAYLKIADGCDKFCTYCVIPYVRGHYRSVPIEQLVEEAGILVSKGVKELILVAQETTLYGVDLYGQKKLPELLKSLCEIEDLKWVRLLYCYPEEITDELIAVMKEEPKIVNYLDMPVQHASDEILKRMGRKTNRETIEALVKKLRKEIPDICLRTTLINGFPTEKRRHHKELKEFVSNMQFDRLGSFTYSPEENTPAVKMKGQVPQFIKNKRKKEIMLLQQEIAFNRAKKYANDNNVIEVMIEGELVEEGVFVGRSYKDAPGVDGLVFIHGARNLMSGDFIKVRITDAKEYDLIGEYVDEFAE